MTQLHTHAIPDRSAARADAVGGFVALRLTESTQQVGRDNLERLRAAREQALAVRKRGIGVALMASAAASSLQVAVSSAAGASGRGAGSLLGGLGPSDDAGMWTRLASLVPLVALVAGLTLINASTNQYRASELAEVDAQLLTHELPPAAYADPGFVEFLRASVEDAGAAASEPAAAAAPTAADATSTPTASRD